MQKLSVTRYQQKPGQCAVAACATVANYHDNDRDYKKTEKIAIQKVVPDLGNGLDSGEIGSLLNYLGFQKVDIVSTNLNFLDYSWAKYKKNKIITKIKKAKASVPEEYRVTCDSLYKWLSLKEFDNNLIIDYNFGEHIRKTIDEGFPLVLSFNWTMYFKFAKYNGMKPDSIKGEYEEHAVVAYGYNSQGVYICDSHFQYYKYRLKKYKDGLYNISWENLMTIMGWGDLYLPKIYEKRNYNN